jgi:pre-mRNA-splicing factor SYF1
MPGRKKRAKLESPAKAMADPSPPSVETAFEIEEADLPFEEQLQSAPYDFNLWWQYIRSWVNVTKDVPAGKLFLLFERALARLPGSYKLWMAYLEERKKRIRNLPPTSPAYEQVNQIFERAIIHLRKMPRVWFDYTNFLRSQGLVTKTRQTFDRALRELPVTLHSRVWELYINFAKQSNSKATAVDVFKRYLEFTPSASDEFLEMLKQMKNWRAASVQLYCMAMDPDYTSPAGTSKESMWESLAEIVGNYADALEGLDVEEMLRNGLQVSVEHIGQLWVGLANYYTRLGHFDRAEKTFQEGCDNVSTARDFGVVFDAFAKYHESMISAEIEFLNDENEEEDDEEEEEEDGSSDELDARMAQLELLLEQRELLMNRALLRRNQSDVNYWLRQASLLATKPMEAIECYETAVKSIDPSEACNGRLGDLWISYAQYLQSDRCDKNVAEARKVLQRARAVEYRLTEELAAVWCAGVELELKARKFNEAFKMIQQGVRQVGIDEDKDENGAKITVCRRRLFKDRMLWALCLDLEENLGTIATARAAYDRCISLKVASPFTVLNYANMLTENKYFEDSFRAFEKGLSLFSFPHASPIWTVYLQSFVDRYGGSKLERTRDLFEECCDSIPNDMAKSIFFMYADFEEEYGLPRRAMDIYDRAVDYVVEQDKYDVYVRYIARAEELFGTIRTRDVYQKALETLPDINLKDIGIKFTEMELELDDVVRARAILNHVSQTCDPRVDKSFWQYWRKFEIAHGDEDTFKEMLRVQRSVKASFLTSTIDQSLVDRSMDASTTSGVADQPPASVNSNHVPSFIAASPAGGGSGFQEEPVEDDAEIDIGMSSGEDG